MMTDDLKSVLYTEEQIAKRVAEMGAELTRDYAGKNPIVVGILKGASMPSVDGSNLFPFKVGNGRPGITVDIIQGQDTPVIGPRQLPDGLLNIDPDG